MVPGGERVGIRRDLSPVVGCLLPASSSGDRQNESGENSSGDRKTGTQRPPTVAVLPKAAGLLSWPGRCQLLFQGASLVADTAP